MSGMDLFEDGFPHGTKEGYELGCKGGACPANTELGLSCRKAETRYRGDYAFQKMVDRGMTPAEIVAAEAAGKPAKRARAAKADTVGVVAVAVVPVADKAAASGKVALVRGRHGAASHYEKGCRHTDCVAAFEALGDELGEVALGLLDEPEAVADEASVDVPVLSPVVEEVIDLKSLGYTDAEVDDMAQQLDRISELGQMLRFAQDQVVSLTLELDVEKAKKQPAEDVRSVTVTLVRGDGFEVHVDATGVPVFEVVLGEHVTQNAPGTTPTQQKMQHTLLQLEYGEYPHDAVKAQLLAQPHRALHIALAVALGHVEGGMEFDRKGWQQGITAAHMQRLQGWGYELSELEQSIVNAKQA
ncbi:hypothetical protein [Glaciibacter superstes]|uniref:hypothetical protein n=1 Tax=Glaciibacter superstes TaxID=501023 RepID=UPI0003B5FA67|nr:hypothetical protein [Glaciibacter superstes]